MNELYWNIQKPLSYNALFNYINGARGVGKTYGTLTHCIKNFAKTGRQFIYLRRYKEELKPLRKENKLFEAVKPQFEVPLDIKNDILYYDNKIMGGMIALSTAKIQKSIPFSYVDYIIFDEYIIDKGFYHYIPDEVTNFLELYITIARDRDVKVFFLSNAITDNNPYFLYYDIPTNRPEFYFHNDILVHTVRNEAFGEHMEKTRFGKMMRGTAYSDYAFHNVTLRDNTNFIRKKPGTARHYFIVKYKEQSFGVWFDINEGYFISRDKDPNCKFIYSLTLEDQRPNILLLKNGRRSTLIDGLGKAFQQGLVFYEDQKIKGLMMEGLKKILL